MYVALITGSSSGIGEAVAIEFARLDYALVIHGTNADRLRAVSDRCAAVSPKALRPIEVLGDFHDTKGTAQKLINKTLEAYGQLDVLVNNAGLFRQVDVDCSNAFDQYDEMVKLNLDSAVQLSLLAVPHLRKTKGNIVNVSSNLRKKCFKGAFAYSAAKAALSMFSKSLAVELAPLVRVNCVSPGPVATGMIARSGMPMEKFREAVGPACLVERVGEAAEIARAILFLAAPASAFITGSDWIIDGGSTIKPEGKLMSQASS